MNPVTQLQSFSIFEDGGLFYSAPKIFYAHYQEIPSIMYVYTIDEKRLFKWVQSSGRVVKKYELLGYPSGRKPRTRIISGIYILDNEVLLDLELSKATLYYKTEHEAAALDVLAILKKFRLKPKKTHDICLVTNGTQGLDIINIKLKQPKLTISKYYNDDLGNVHSVMLRHLKEKNKSGVILLHGIPGTGKSTYIRHLIFQQQKKVIFMPTSMAGNLDMPALTSLLIDNRNSIIVIEDAEDLLLSREQHKNSAISMLLNLTDGLLGESLGIQIIATFNTHLGNIDKALLRKGRLVAIYEFKALNIEKAAVLLKERYSHILPPQKPLTLAEIFNMEQEEADYKNPALQPIGFISRAV